MRRFCLAMVMALTLAGCGSHEQLRQTSYVAIGAKPSNAQAEQAARAWLVQSLKDPGSLQQFAMLGEPQLVSWRPPMSSMLEQAWLVCFEYNAKNSYGGYVGLRREGVAVRLIGDSVVPVPVNWPTASLRCPA